MITPTHRRPNGLDAELDALVAREVDALAQRKSRAANGKAAHEQPAAAGQPEASPQGVDAASNDMPARLDRSRPPPRRERAPLRDAEATNVIGIRHGSRPTGLAGIPFSADEEAFIEDAVAFLRRRANADVIIEEIWMHTVVDDAGQSFDEKARATSEAGDVGDESDDLTVAAQEHTRITLEQAGTPRPRPDDDTDRPAAVDEATESPVPRAKKTPGDKHTPDGSAR